MLVGVSQAVTHGELQSRATYAGAADVALFLTVAGTFCCVEVTFVTAGIVVSARV